MTDYRKRLEKRCAEIDAHYARYPTSPDRTAEQHAADLRKFLAEGDRVREALKAIAAIKRHADENDPWSQGWNTALGQCHALARQARGDPE